MVKKLKNISPISKSFLLIFFMAAIMATLIGYQGFLQIPLSPHSNITWKTPFEQAFSLIPLVASIYSLYRSIRKSPLKKKPLIDEGSLVIPAFIIIYIAGVSVGSHAASEVLQHSFVTEIDPFLKTMFLILDEFVGHIVVFMAFALLYLLSLLEINREPQSRSRKEAWFHHLIALLLGSLLGILSIEAGWSHVVLFPLILVFFFFYLRFLTENKISIRNYPFSHVVFTGSNYYLVAVIVWSVIFGVLTQPSSLLK